MLTPKWEAAERSRAEAWGRSHRRIKPLRVWLNPEHGPALTALDYELVWATTWEQEANEFIAPVLGLPALPFIDWPDPRPEPGGGLYWKTPRILSWARGRAFAWIDDEIKDADRAWVAEHHDAPALLHRVDPGVGLVAADFSALAEWAEELER